jgi:GNAT superfamily N-acetyltransferase
MNNENNDIKILKLDQGTVDGFLEYLKEAMRLEPDMMMAESVDEAGIRARVKDPFYMYTKNILAMAKGKVIGRLEYHFYGCIQDGYRMAYVDWVYVLPAYRHNGVAQKLIRELEKDCRENRINQYYLIRSTKPEADRFYHSFENANLSECPLLRKKVTSTC